MSHPSCGITALAMAFDPGRERRERVRRERRERVTKETERIKDKQMQREERRRGRNSDRDKAKGLIISCVKTFELQRSRN